MKKTPKQVEAESEASGDSENGITHYVVWDNETDTYIVTVNKYDFGQYQTVAAFLNGKKLNERNW